jgi:hypothetical protein
MQLGNTEGVGAAGITLIFAERIAENAVPRD